MTKIISDEQKIKISDAMKLAHSEGRHPGWKHMQDGKRSFPERFFLRGLKTERIIDKFQIVEQFPISKYFLDFALIDYKIDIEIDGSQHYRYESFKEHDSIRDDYLRMNGWKVFRISWSELSKDPKKIFDELEKFIEDNKIERKYVIDEIKLKPQSDVKRQIKLDKKLENIEKIKNSDIDFSKFGWVRKVSELTNIKHQKVGGWMKRNMLDFYKEKCFIKSFHGHI